MIRHEYFGSISHEFRGPQGFTTHRLNWMVSHFLEVLDICNPESARGVAVLMKIHFGYSGTRERLNA